MPENLDLIDNYSHSTVPDSALVSGWHVANIINGIAVALPAFLVGSKFMMALGTLQGTAALLTGGAILAFIAAGNMYVACRERTNTVNILHQSFGRSGQLIISLIISGTLLGWYGVTATLFAQAAQKALQEVFGIMVPAEALAVLGSVVMIVTTIYGFRAIDWLSRLSVPFMVFILLYGVYSVLSDYPLNELISAQGQLTEDIPSFAAGVSFIVGAFMVGVVMLPDFARFIRRPSQVVPASVFSYGSFAVLVMAVAGLPALMTGEPDLITSMYQTGLGLPALIIMVLATVTTNVSNLYSTELGLAQLFPKVADWKLTTAAGIVGTAISIAGVLDHLFSFVLLLSIFIPPISGIYLSHFFLSRNQVDRKVSLKSTAVSYPAILTWALASLIAFSSSKELFTLTTIPALDSWLSALLLYPVFAWSKRLFRHTKEA